VLPIAKAGDRNSRIGSIGAGARRSQATNAAADVSASTQGAVVPGLVCLVA